MRTIYRSGNLEVHLYDEGRFGSAEPVAVIVDTTIDTDRPTTIGGPVVWRGSAKSVDRVIRKARKVLRALVDLQDLEAPSEATP